MLAAEGSRIDAEIGVQAILGRNARLHVGLIAFAAGDPDRLVRRQCEYAGVSIESPAHILAGANFGQPCALVMLNIDGKKEASGGRETLEKSLKKRLWSLSPVRRART